MEAAGARFRLPLVRTLCALAAFIALLSLAGWVLRAPLLTSVFAGAVEMKVNTALCLLVLSASLLLRAAENLRHGLAVSRALAALVVVVGALTLLQYALGWNAGINELLFRDERQTFNPVPGLMSPLSAIAFMALGSGLAVPATPATRTLLMLTAILTCSIGLVSLGGYGIGARELTTDEVFPPVAANTAVAFLALGIAAILADPLAQEFWRAPDSIASLRSKLLVGFGIALLVLGATGTYAYRMQLRSLESHQALLHAAQVRHLLQSIHTSVAEAESAQEYYLLVDDPIFRREFDRRAQEARGRLQELQLLLVGDPGQDANLQQLAGLLAGRLDALSNAISMARLQGLQTALGAMTSGSALTGQLALRNLIDRMDARQRERIAQLSQTALRNRGYTLLALLLTLGICTSLLVLLFVSILSDLRQRARTHEAMLETQRQAQRATRAKSEFLAAMSHEIRTPMNGVLGMLDLLEQGSLQQREIEMVRITRDSAESLLGIIEDILDFSKIEAGRMDLEREPLALADTVERACTLLDRLAERQSVQLAVFCDPALPSALLGDAMRLRQVIINLVSNAIKFSAHLERAGRVAVRARLLDLAAGHAALELRVEDNGIGMDAATVAGLFQPFMQGDVSTTRRFGGTGLGLAITHQLVELMRGTISVQSQPDAGSVFTVRLALEVHRAPAEATDAAPLEGIDCVVVGPEGGTADDLAAYLVNGGAGIRRLPALPEVHELPPVNTGAAVWVVVTGDDESLEALLARLRRLAGAEGGIVIVATGRRRRMASTTAGRCVVIDGNALPRAGLHDAVRVAAGREAAVPVAAQSAGTRLARAAPTREEAIRRGQLVLVAEDNSTNQEVVHQQLALLGYAADIAPDGAQALRLWAGGDYSLVLTDLHMPKMDGYGLAMAIRLAETGPDRIPIIALTANAMPGEDDRCLEAGMDGYLTKPTTLAALRAMLDRWLPHAPESDSALQLAVLRELVGDDPDTITALLVKFHASATQAGVEMHRAGEARMPQALAAAAHKLKSSARAVGALQLAALCETIEKASRLGDQPAADEALVQFRAELQAVMVAVRECAGTALMTEHPA